MAFVTYAGVCITSPKLLKNNISWFGFYTRPPQSQISSKSLNLLTEKIVTKYTSIDSAPIEGVVIFTI